jgi:hypothetical protein
MGISITSDSATIGTTEYSLPNDSTSLTAQTDDCILQVWIDFANMTAAEEYEVKVYEKINAGTARIVYKTNVIGAQSHPLVTPSLIVGEGWDVTVDKIAGTDRSIAWSIRKIT